MIDLRGRPIAVAKRLGGRYCLDFVNTIGGRKQMESKGTDSYVVSEDRLNDYSDLLAWGMHVGLMSEAEARRFLREAHRHPAEAQAVWNRAINNQVR